MKAQKPSNLEMQVLSVLWKNGPATARQVLDALPDGKERAYTTVLSVMQVMEKKGFLKHSAEGNRHVFTPLVKRTDVMGSFFRSVVNQMFGGKASHAMQHLLQTGDVSDEDLSEMRKLIDEYAEKKASTKLEKKK